VALFAGDRRVWRVAALAALPALALMLFYCVKPRKYYTGTNSVEVYTYIAPSPAGSRMCVNGLEVPANTTRLNLQLVSLTTERPRLAAAIELGGRLIRDRLPPTPVAPSRVSIAELPIPETRAKATPARICMRSGGLVNWGGTPLSKPGTLPPTLDGAPLPARVAVWYLPPAGKRASYLSRIGEIFERAALFRPGVVGAWTYVVLFFVLLPALALLAVRTLAVAAAGRTRRLAAWVFAIAALNACCWALITPVFQAPDEVDHLAYTQSLVERGEGPSHNPGSPLQRWSGAENRALEDTGFNTDHEVGDTKVPWLRATQQRYEDEIALKHPSGADGGGYTTSAVHGPLYYLALAPSYILTSGGSIFSQLTLMRMTSALIGALVVLFTFLLVRELAPGRPWLAVLAALIVAFQPMYGFICGIVNNDVGINAAAAALELLLIRILRRGVTVSLGLLTGVVLLAIPMIKGTGLALYPLAGIVLLVALWRHHKRRDLVAWGVLALGALAMGEVSKQLLSKLHPAEGGGGGGGGGGGSAGIAESSGAVTQALHHPSGYLSYLWQVFLPRLGFMAPHFPSNVYPAFVIFIERGWGAFGWYDVFFPNWVYWVIFVVVLATFLLGAWALYVEWPWVRRNWITLLVLLAIPVSVVAAFEAAYYTPGMRGILAEFGRYAFPAIGAFAALVVGALHAFGRRHMLTAGTVLLVAMISLSYAGQLVELTTFYA
jgi:hypothetical protein